MQPKTSNDVNQRALCPLFHAQLSKKDQNKQVLVAKNENNASDDNLRGLWLWYLEQANEFR